MDWVAGGDIYQAIGGAAGCRLLAEMFYKRVEGDPVLRPLFPGKSLRCAMEAFSAFLVQFLGGPPDDSQFRWWVSLQESHQRFRIGAQERDAWMRNMNLALEDAQIAEPARMALRGFFDRSSAYVVNQVACVSEVELAPEIGRRWDRQRVLDEAVAAVRRGDAAAAIALAESMACHAGLLALMIERGDDAMLGYVEDKLRAEPILVNARYNGRTLLHFAAAAGSVRMVETLLGLGAGANALDGGGHAPLYSAGNECKSAGGAEVIRALVRAGADVNACGGVTRCTPLHMAARRGNVEIARALVDCGADLDARDARGDTPLQRALNCRKREVVALLRRRVHDP